MLVQVFKIIFISGLGDIPCYEQLSIAILQQELLLNFSKLKHIIATEEYLCFYSVCIYVHC